MLLKQSKEREEVGKGKGEEARLSNRTGRSGLPFTILRSDLPAEAFCGRQCKSAMDAKDWDQRSYRCGIGEYRKRWFKEGPDSQVSQTDAGNEQRFVFFPGMTQRY